MRWRVAFYCEYDEYEVNRPINRVIRGALDIVARCTQDASNTRLCNELRYVFDRVPATKNANLDFSRIQRDRSMQHYEPALPLCQLILSGLNPLTSTGNHAVFSVLFPMERVFESYVAHMLPKQLPQMQIEPQVSSKYLVESVRLRNRLAGSQSTRRLFRLKPDLELTSSSIAVHLIADTKWKLLDQENSSQNYEIKQSDMYQLFAYGEKYFSTNDNTALILIYPRSERFNTPLPVFWFDQARTQGIHVLPFDLDNDFLCLSERLNEMLTAHELKAHN